MIGSLIAIMLCVMWAVPAPPNLTVESVAYRVIPHQRTRYYSVPGHYSSSCDGAGTIIGNSASWNSGCSGTATPAQTYPVTAQWVEVWNQVKANGNVYVLYCRANWRGSNCLHLNPGDHFEARVDGNTMWIYGRKGGNLGKQIKSKMTMLDMRPIEEAARSPIPR